MDEYIDRGALGKTVEHIINNRPRGGVFSLERMCIAIIEAIRNAPTADVVEVRHGEWKGKPIAGLCTVGCSVCGMAFSQNSGRWLYCPNCGAKMDGKRKDGAE